MFLTINQNCPFNLIYLFETSETHISPFLRVNRDKQGGKKIEFLNVPVKWIGFRIEFDVDGGLQVLDPLHGQLQVVLGQNGLGLGQLELLLQFVLLRVRLGFLLLGRRVILPEVSELTLKFSGDVLTSELFVPKNNKKKLLLWQIDTINSTIQKINLTKIFNLGNNCQKRRSSKQQSFLLEFTSVHVQQLIGLKIGEIFVTSRTLKTRSVTQKKTLIKIPK